MKTIASRITFNAMFLLISLGLAIAIAAVGIGADALVEFIANLI
jgi:hypothetical protein